MSGTKSKILLFLILILALILRFYQLGQIPTGLEWDEVAIGYDAYSVLKTGRDQFGHFLPLTFRSLDDYKPPLYEYLCLIPLAIFDLNEFAVRFPSAFFGTLSVFLTYFLVKEFFKQRKKLALLSAFLLAISPWHLQFSRAAFEVNLSVFIIIAAVLFFIKGLTKKFFLPVAASFFGLALFSYHSTRVVTPLLLLSLIFLFWPKINFRRKIVWLSGFIYLIFVFFFLPIVFSPEAQIRFKVTNISNIFSDQLIIENINQAQIADNKVFSDRLFRLFHGQKPLLLRTLIRGYLVHFSPDFLFLKGDVPLHHAPNFGLLYLFELPFILIGLFLFLKKYLQRDNFIILIWFLIAPLPAAVTQQVPHAVRSEIFLPTFQIFAGLGVYGFFQFVKKRKLIVKIAYFVLLAFFFFDFSTYLHQYYVHTPYELSKQWMYGRKEAALFADSIKDKYDKILVSARLEHPYIFFLFYLKYDPAQYLKEGGTVSGGWAEDRNRFDKYEFRYIHYEELKKTTSNVLVVAKADEIPASVSALKTIYYLNGEEAIKIVEI